MRKELKFVGLFFLFVILSSLAISFIAMNLNPFHWDSTCRVIFVLMFIPISIIFAFIIVNDD